MSDVKTVLSDPDEPRAASTTGEKTVGLCEGDMGMLKHAKETVQHLQVAVVTKSEAIVRATDGYVHDHPWRAMGVAGGVGLLIGLLLNRT